MTSRDPIWTQEFQVRHYEVDFQGKLSPLYLCRILQETAGSHAESLSFGPAKLRLHQLSWVLSKFHIKMTRVCESGDPEWPRWPRWRDRLIVQTWRCGIERIFA